MFSGHGEGHPDPGAAEQEPHHHRHRPARGGGGQRDQLHARAQVQDQHCSKERPHLPQAQCLRVSWGRRVRQSRLEFLDLELSFKCIFAGGGACTAGCTSCAQPEQLAATYPCSTEQPHLPQAQRLRMSVVFMFRVYAGWVLRHVSWLAAGLLVDSNECVSGRGHGG